MKLLMMVVLLMAVLGNAQDSFSNVPVDINAKAMSVHDFTVKTIDDQDKNLKDFKGKVLLIVNTASRCGFTPQYKGLEAVYQEFKGQGFEVLGFPANNFMGQEPGNNQEIKNFCELKFKTTFPLFAKISVSGSDIAPLYQYLTSVNGFSGNISWNFNKFLIDKNGHVVARFGSSTEPQSVEIVDQIKKLLAS